MKIKRLLTIVLLLGLAGASQAITQTDVVGYWTHEFKPGFNLVAFPVLPDTPTLQEVFGDRLGSAQITTYDRQLRDYRWASFNTETARWEGNLFLLGRGTAFWVYIPGNEAKTVVVTGHPELYTKFRWDQLRHGWQFFAPTLGKAEALSELPPVEVRDLVLGWNNESAKFTLADITPDLTWHSSELNQIAPDKAYIALLHRQQLRPVGPPLEIEVLFERYSEPVVENPNPQQGAFRRPPEPLIVGNESGLAVCNPNGEPCNGELRVIAFRERTRIGQGGELETYSEQLNDFRVTTQANAGRFVVALALGEEDGMLAVGDRITLVVRNGRGGETRSTSFEVPADTRVVNDVEFTEELRTAEALPLPMEFSLGTPFPNPFNDRFELDVKLPESSVVKVNLFDITGRSAYNFNLPLGAGAHRLTVPAGGVSAGVYLVQVTAGKHKGLTKVAHLK